MSKSKSKRTAPNAMAADDEKPVGPELNISFGTIKKSVVISCRYDTAYKASRAVAWQACQELGLDVVDELVENYNTKIGKIVQYEVQTGEIVFDAATTCNQSIRKKAIAVVEDRLKEQMDEPRETQNDPEMVQ